MITTVLVVVLAVVVVCLGSYIIYRKYKNYQYNKVLFNT